MCEYCDELGDHDGTPAARVPRFQHFPGFLTAEEQFLNVLRQKYLPWILSELDLKGEDQVLRFYHERLQGLREVMLKKVLAENNSSIIDGRPSSLVSALCKKIKSVTLHPDMTFGHIKATTTVQKGGLCWILEENNFMATADFEGLNFPIVFVRYCASSAYNNEWISNIFVAKKHFNQFAKFIQELERDLKTITLVRMDAADIDVKPLLWDELTLEPNIASMVKEDFEDFLDKRAWYRKKRLPYRRGYLFHGLQGNGKTSTIKAMMTQAQCPAFTMKKYGHKGAEDVFENMFLEAAKNELAIVVLEDLDRAFGTRKNTERSVDQTNITLSSALNCMDGLGNEDGLILIATANNPKALDPAILERPGRFDRVVGFPNPSLESRLAFFQHYSPHLLSTELRSVVEPMNLTFAQLKETYILAHRFASDAKREDIVPADVALAAKKLAESVRSSNEKVGMV